MQLDLSHLSDSEHDIFVQGWLDAKAGVLCAEWKHDLYKMGHNFWMQHHAN